MKLPQRKGGRTEKSMLNALTGIFGQMFSYVLSFAIRTVFIKTLGETYLGLNGLYSNILSVLNMSELGLGTAIVIELYRTVAQNDEEKSKQYLQLYKRAYLCIGGIILVAGLAITPFLEYFVNDKESLALINYRLVFILYLINTCFSYFFFEYRMSILQANQAEYRARLISYGFKLIEMILQIVSLLMFGNIYVYLIIPIVLGCISTVTKGVLIGRWYPFIKEAPEGKLSAEEVKQTWKNIGSVAMYKISGTVINSTDNIILSSYISLILAGLYSNYLIIVAAVRTILEKVFSAFTASIGNLNAEAGADDERKYQVFKTLSFLNFWLYGFCAVCMYVLFKPFVALWIGPRFILNTATEAAIVLNFLVFGLQETVGTHRAAYGLFYRGRFRPVFSVAVNIVASIGLVKMAPAEYGVVAVLAGTMLSNLTVSWWFDAYIVHKYGFHRSPVQYYVTYWKRMAYIVAVGCLIKYLCSLVSIGGMADIVLYGLICAGMYNLLFALLFFRTQEFRFFYNRLQMICRRVLKR